jgi:hypothetical protein
MPIRQVAINHSAPSGRTIDLFEFIAGMLGVILALVVAQLFLGLANLVHSRAPVRASLSHALWVANLFLFTFQHWWSLWDFRAVDWTFPLVLYSLIGPSLLFFAATLVSPRDVSTGAIDLRDHFLLVRRPLMIVLLVAVVVVTLDGLLLGTEDLFNRLRLQQLVIVVGTAAVLVSERDRIHLAGSLAVTVALGAGLFIRFFPGLIS